MSERILKFSGVDISDPEELVEVSDIDLVRQVPVYDFDALLTNLSKYRIDYVDEGFHGVVFKLGKWKTNFTLKLMKSLVKTSELQSLFTFSGFESPDFMARYISTSSFGDKWSDWELCIKQTAGHVLGHVVLPRLVDAPLCMWVRNGEYGYRPVGYSIPWIEGEAVKICEDKYLTSRANYLENNFGLYVGNRGAKTESRNAIVSPSGKKRRFIDVQTRP
jgi:hypothetical protein